MSQDRYTFLIYQELQKTLTVTERNELQSWLDASPDHFLQKEQILAAMKSLDATAPTFEVNVEGDYAKVADALGLHKKSKAISSTNKWMKWLLFAALLLGICAGGYYYINKQEVQSPVLRAMNAADELQEIQLADGSIVKLNVGSTLRYPDTFDGNNREVELTGEAFFDIAKDESMPFIITTAQSRVEVLGTSFNVRETDDEQLTTVAVLTGQVRMTSLANDKSVTLSKEQKGTIYANGKISKEDNENLNALAWESGILRFKSTPLGEVFGDIASFYDVSILNKSKDIEDCTYSMSSQSISLDNLLENLNKLYHFEIERKVGNLIIVSGGDCN